MGEQPAWWTPPWRAGGPDDPDSWTMVEGSDGDGSAWPAPAAGGIALGDEAILQPLEAEFGQIRSRERVRDLAEVFTHQREIDAMLDLIPDSFAALDVKFLEPTCGSGNFLTEILWRKLRLVRSRDCQSQEQYEHQLLRAAASVYGVDISPENITEARGRLAHVLLEHYQQDANTVSPTPGFLHAAALVLGANTVLGDTLNAAADVEMCDWRPYPDGRFQRVWSFALVPEGERDLFWAERIEDSSPVHYAELKHTAATAIGSKR